MPVTTHMQAHNETTNQWKYAQINKSTSRHLITPLVGEHFDLKQIAPRQSEQFPSGICFAECQRISLT